MTFGGGRSRVRPAPVECPSLMHSNSRASLVCLAALLLGGATCPPRREPPGSDGTSYVVRLESSGGGFLRVDSSTVVFGAADAEASFVLFDLNRGGLESGDEVLLLNRVDDSYLRGGSTAANVGTRLSGLSVPG